MGTNLKKDTYPSGSGPDDFECFGPPALKDGEFDTVKICDMGCFKQDGQDSNKYYHGAIVKHRTTGQIYVYFEWGRTGARSSSFQFVECTTEADAQREFAKQLHSKNDKRGEWITIAGIRTLRAKADKDCYLVRPMATRSTGLPDARKIKTNDGAKTNPKTGSELKPAGDGIPVRAKKIDEHTLSLMHDLNVATVQYAKGSMADDSIPTQVAIDEARTILCEAEKRLLVVGANVQDQVSDGDLKQLTTLMYGRIPKKKELRAAAEKWILNQDNISMWRQDLDAFESALYVETQEVTIEHDPFGGMPIQMEWLDPKSVVGKWLYEWWPEASANKHGNLRKPMKIKNLWKVVREGDHKKLVGAQDEILSHKAKIKERPLFQPVERNDMESDEYKRYKDSNTFMGFHGSRSVNVSGILRESLRMPKTLVGVVITGANFGPGLYFADDWRKSAGYTSLHGSYWSQGGGSVRGRDAFMFIVDVVAGQPYVAPGTHGYTSPPKDHHCIFAKGSNHYRDDSGVQNNEWIIFKREQHELRYLAEFSA